MNSESMRQLQTLARESDAAASAWTAARHVDTAREYTRLRALAWRVVERNGWATETEFVAQFPPFHALAEIERLNEQYGERLIPEALEPGAPVQRALRHLSAWAAGARLAGDLSSERGLD